MARFVALVGCVLCLTPLPAAHASLGSGAEEVAPCLKARHLPPFTAYALGPRFAGLALTDESRECFAPPGGHLVGPGPRAVAWTSTAIYGTCTPEAGSEGGCGPPLEIESWPECDRDYAPFGTQRDLRAATALRLTGSRRIPAVQIEHGLLSHIEMYTGRTTIVIFAAGVDPDSLARRAAHALARLIVPRLRPVGFARLRALAVSTRGCPAR